MNTKYNSKGEGFGKVSKKKGMVTKAEEANEKKMMKAGKPRKNKLGKAAKEVAKTKRSVKNVTHNMPMSGKNRTTSKADVMKAL